MSDFANLVIQHMVKGIREQRDAFRKELGETPGQEEVSPEIQMEAYKSLTAEDIAQLRAKHGPEVGKRFLDMEERLRRKKNAFNG